MSATVERRTACYVIVYDNRVIGDPILVGLWGEKKAKYIANQMAYMFNEGYSTKQLEVEAAS